MTSTPEELVADAFVDYFEPFDVRISAADVTVGNHRTIVDQQHGWVVTFRVDSDDAGQPALEFYATNRWTNDRHVLLRADGQMEHLAAIQELIFEPSDHERNDALKAQLHDRRLYPHGLGAG